MRLKAGRQLGRDTAQRQALLKHLVTALFKFERIETTVAKAKEVGSLAERLVTLAKHGDLHARRQSLRIVRSKEAIAKLFDVLGPRYADRHGGYTRILRTTGRRGDGAPLALVEMVGSQVVDLQKKRQSRKREASKREGEASG